MYDEVIGTKNWVTKVRIGSLIGYYNLTAIKYATLGDFIFGLARFSLANGSKGYVDVYGKEYYD